MIAGDHFGKIIFEPLSQPSAARRHGSRAGVRRAARIEPTDRSGAERADSGASTDCYASSAIREPRLKIAASRSIRDCLEPTRSSLVVEAGQPGR